MNTRVTLSKKDSRELLLLLTKGAEIIYGRSTVPRELNIARRMRLLRGKIERKSL